MTNEAVAAYNPRLLDDIPAWVIENIQAVSAYMKTHGHEDWTIAGVRSPAAHAREVDRAVANDRVRDVHTCHDQCTKTELCRMTRRAEAAEARLGKVREIAERMTNEAIPATNNGLTLFVPFYQLAALRDAAIASGGEDRKA